MPYLRDLGVDAIWVTPFYPSPQNDHGYDVSEYRDVDPRFGTLADFDELAADGPRARAAPDRRPRPQPHVVRSRVVPGGAGVEAAESGATRYIFRPGRGSDGDQPPNNWRSVFGGPAWTRVEDGEWYLHLFDASQPDLNWRQPEVREEFESILRFWLDRGVDGFRVDVAHGLIKDTDLPDRVQPRQLPRARRTGTSLRSTTSTGGGNRCSTSYDGDRMAVAEAWAATTRRMARYVRRDEYQQAFNFHWLEAPWSAAAFRKVIDRTYAAVGPVRASPTWVLSNHDVVREVTRYGGGVQGLARSKAATLAMLALPGSAYIYQGEELGLPEVDVPDKDRQDPAFFRGAGPGRDGCRVPMPWSGSERPTASVRTGRLRGCRSRRRGGRYPSRRSTRSRRPR